MWRRALGATLALLGVELSSAPACAREYRRPGLEGQWTERHLTQPMNSLRILAGPGQPTLFGARMDDENVDGGAQYIHGDREGAGAPLEDEWWIRGGLSFGLTEDWEAGALFVPFQLAPELDLASVTAFVTRGFRFESWDIGLRFSFQSPSLKAFDFKEWTFNPGVPFLYRAGPVRLDAAVLVPFASRNWVFGLNVPLRASLSLGPRFFVALESGFVEPNFVASGDTTVPLAALVGYSELFGCRVVDFTASFAWDSFWLPSAPEGTEKLELDRFRVGLGLTIHMLVR
jgi:hypothetical protein